MSKIGAIGRQLFGIVLGGTYVLGASCATAQITPDRTLPHNSSVTINGNVFNITGGTQAGRNLFHSFQQFSVPTGSTASFNNGVDIQNIISRVTGGEVSNIDGIIQASGTANLFLINPNGIIFGKNASLSIGGSFVGSTASSLKFADGFEFSATSASSTPLLTISVPIGLQYKTNPGSISNQSIAVDANNIPVGLMVSSGNSLALVGGDVSLDGGRLTAAGGRVELGGLTAPGTVGLQVDGNNLSLSFPTESARASVSLINGASVNVSGGGGGSITVNANNLNITGGSSLIGGIAPGMGNVGAIAGDITLNATGEIKVVDSSVSNDVASSILVVDNGGNIVGFIPTVGNGGNINISSSSFSLIDNNNLHYNAIPYSTYLSASTYGQGNAGSVKINTSGSVTINNSSVMSLVSGTPFTYQGVEGFFLIGMGNSGGISISTRLLTVTNSAQLNASISAGGTGQAGDITIRARDSVLFDGGFAFSRLEQAGKGRGGDIRITTDGSVRVTGIPIDYAINSNTGQLVTATFGEGDAGNVMITAGKDVSFDGRGSDIFSLVAGDKGIGNAGDIIINSRSLSVLNGARLVARTEGQGNAGNINITAHDTIKVDGLGSDIDSFVAGGTGSGGTITLNTGALSLTNGASVTADTRGIGAAGNVIIDATNNVSVDNKSTISSSSSDDFNGGDIQIKSSELELTNGASLQASASGIGNAGDIRLLAGKLILDNRASISAQTTSSNGGNITLTPLDLLLLRHNSQISTTAGITQLGGNGGNGGNINISAPNGFIVAVENENSDITANAFFGSGGAVKINAQGIYNFNQLSLQDLETLLKTNDPTKLDPQQLPTNDITAISLTSPTLSGQVNIITPEVDPSRGLVTLPTVTEVAPKLISSNCANFNETASGSNFTVTGRSGLPPSPDEPLTSDVVWSDTRLPVTTLQHQRKIHAAKSKPQPIAIIPATGWVLNDLGEVMLISSVTNATSVNTPTSCPAK